MSEYISKEELIKFVDNLPSELTEDGRRMIRAIKVKEYIADCPSADVRPNIHGYWEDDREGFEHCHCSKCGQIIFSCQKWFKCCPRCMTVMDGEPKGEKGTE